MAEERLISEPYLIKQWEFAGAKKIAGIMGDLGAGRAQWSYENNKTTDRYWKPEKHHFDITSHKDKRKRNIAVFRDHYYLDESGIVYGTPRTISEEKEQVEGSAQTYDNSLYEDKSHETYIREATTGSTVSHTMSEAHELSIKSTVKNQGKLWRCGV